MQMHYYAFAPGLGNLKQTLILWLSPLFYSLEQTDWFLSAVLLHKGLAPHLKKKHLYFMLSFLLF